MFDWKNFCKVTKNNANKGNLMETINRKLFRSPLTQEEKTFIEDHYNIDMSAKQIAEALGYPLRVITNYYHVFCRRQPVEHEEFKDPNTLWAERYLRMPWVPTVSNKSYDSDEVKSKFPFTPSEFTPTYVEVDDNGNILCKDLELEIDQMQQVLQQKI